MNIKNIIVLSFVMFSCEGMNFKKVVGFTAGYLKKQVRKYTIKETINKYNKAFKKSHGSFTDGEDAIVALFKRKCFDKKLNIKKSRTFLQELNDYLLCYEHGIFKQDIENIRMVRAIQNAFYRCESTFNYNVPSIIEYERIVSKKEYLLLAGTKHVFTEYVIWKNPVTNEKRSIRVDDRQKTIIKAIIEKIQ